MSNSCRIRIATLNCRSLRKTSNPSQQKLFIRYLCSLDLDIIAFQETHADNAQIMNQLNMQFQTSSALWSQHCGIVSLNPQYMLKSICKNVAGRYILAAVHPVEENTNDSSSPLPLLSILNIYAPATQSARIKATFFNNMMEDVMVQLYVTRKLYNTVMLGDFNYNMEKRALDGSVYGPPTEWIDLLQTSFYDCFCNDK